jgi:pimeloyl-ACP methyl ester carboxylesterase
MLTSKPICFVSLLLPCLVLTEAAAQLTNAPRAVQSDALVPFRIHVPDEEIDDLIARLARTRFPDEIDGVGWDYGTSLAYLKDLVEYWRDDFDWRAQEQRLNRFDHFKTNIDGLDLHFIHQRSERADAMPIVLSHGWPGSFIEFIELIGPLSDPGRYGADADDAFHVVVVSLPGFGFSDKPRVPGYTPERMADAIAALMARLGYDRYGAQGGDWGSRVSRFLAINYADHVAGLHLNFCQAGPPPGTEPRALSAEDLTPAERAGLAAREAFMAEGRGYFELQSTKPQTVGYALNDSPAGLAAWIVEKFQSWSDSNGDVERSFTKDELLTNVSLYWFTQTATSSARIYYEQRHAAPQMDPKVTVPTACALFPKELIAPPRAWAENAYNLTRWTEMPRGGHFAAMEEPELLIEDLREFFRDLRRDVGPGP